jgi:hypothetical protein
LAIVELICTDTPFVDQVAQPAQRERVRAGHAAEAIVRVRIRAVEADRDARESRCRRSSPPPARSTSVPLVGSAIRKPLSTP